MRVPSAGHASPRKSVSTPAMMRRSVLFPAPFAPSTPILAPGKKDSQMPFRISRLGGTTFLRSFIVKMYWCAIGLDYKGRHGLGGEVASGIDKTPGSSL